MATGKTRGSLLIFEKAPPKENRVFARGSRTMKTLRNDQRVTTTLVPMDTRS
jgi:hypothetical protein